MKISKKDLKEIIKEEIEATIDEGAELKIPVERYDTFKRKIEQWAMLFNKFTAYTRDIHRADFDRKTDGKRIARMAYKLESELRKIMQEFDFDAKVYDDERYAMRQKLDQFDGGSEFFMEEEVIEEDGKGCADTDKGCIRKRKDGWVILNNKKGGVFRKCDSRSHCEEILDAFHASKG
tara:strand:+ start:273 stop:806 length:534 start_codon:yes stop_codon:yes gene_type:complete